MATLRIKLRCSSWQQLATIYRRDLARSIMFLKASSPPPVGTEVHIDLEMPSGTMIELVKKRAGWLAILFVGEMFTATAMGFFEDEISKAVVLALFLTAGFVVARSEKIRTLQHMSFAVRSGVEAVGTRSEGPE